MWGGRYSIGVLLDRYRCIDTAMRVPNYTYILPLLCTNERVERTPTHPPPPSPPSLLFLRIRRARVCSLVGEGSMCQDGALASAHSPPPHGGAPPANQFDHGSSEDSTFRRRIVHRDLTRPVPAGM